jgi:hypothetical protein
LLACLLAGMTRCLLVCLFASLLACFVCLIRFVVLHACCMLACLFYLVVGFVYLGFVVCGEGLVDSLIHPPVVPLRILGK